MAQLIRVDAELVRRGLARSRAQAAEMILAGRVKVQGDLVTKPATRISNALGITVAPDETDENYASRGAYKLEGALVTLGDCAPRVEGALCLDAGASTGGFTDVLLRRGACRVIAADVGYGQLVWRLQQDSRVVVMDRTNVRYLSAADLPFRPELIVSDLSFISLTLVLPALIDCAADNADLLVMVKPQFEVGKEQLGAGGVVRDPRLHLSSVLKVAKCAENNGAVVKAVAASPLPGPAGNVEYFIHCRLERKSNASKLYTDARSVSVLCEDERLSSMIESAIERGPACVQSN